MPMRFNAAVAVMPYCHPKLIAMDARVYAQLTSEPTSSAVDPALLDATARATLQALVDQAMSAADEESNTINGVVVARGG